MSITDIGKEEAENADTGGVTGDDYERYDVTELEYLKSHPTTAVGGTAVALRYFPGDPDDNNLDRGFAGLVVDDPFLYTGGDEALAGSAVFSKDEGEKGDDLKAVNLEDDDTKHIEDTGVDFDGNVFYGEQIDSIDNDQVVIKLTGNAGRSAICCLDVHGKGGAEVETTDTGQPKINPETGYPDVVPALLEYFDNDEDNYTPPRYYRDTELRPDMEGEQVVFMIQRMRDVKEDYDGDSYWSTVLTATEDGDGQADMEFETVQPTDEFEPSEELLRATSWLESYPEREEIARACVDQGVQIPDKVREYLSEENEELLRELQSDASETTEAEA
ncbi:hypothetical protein [Halosegnis longus]|uniref:hypothetical protein n=1 Tax=Halosegnis longus TaxID=2216012 RepID=UPI00129E6ACB|nr:hypothetical protein [Halosegnis longus]